MNELCRSMGFEILSEKEISIDNDGFEYVGDGPKTPPFHLETLTNKIDPERRKALKSLDIVSKQ